MATLACAVCLYEVRFDVHYPKRLMPEAAVTIANGQAVCPDHFVSIARKLSPDFGQIGLSFLKDARSDRTPPAESR